jgi:hypothetical protein
MSAHTPGPWSRFAPLGLVGNWWAEHLPEGSLVIATGNDAGDRVIAATPSQQDANAHLIAAAPDLYAALEAALSLLTADLRTVSDSTYKATVGQIRSAIAKARGGS